MTSVIDFKKLKEASKIQEIKPLFAIILGPSGAGKSSAMGTFGVPTLFLHTSREHHGPDAARAMGGEITSINITKYKKDGEVDADASINNLISTLKAPGLSENFGAVCIDSANDLQKLFHQTSAFFNFCKTDKGGHNTYREGDADNTQFLQLHDALIKLSEQGMQVAMSCAAIVKSLADDGSVLEASPSLTGFTVAHDLIRLFSDVLLVSRLTEVTSKIVDDEEITTAKVVHKFIFKANLSKVSKDLKTKAIMKTANFSPRITGFTVEDLPDTCEANLAKIIAGRAKKINKTVK